MESILVVYRSETGFTKKYVDWIADKIECNTVLFDQINDIDLNNYSIIIYGAGMHAGRIKGLKKFKNKVFGLDDKKVIVFATGAAPYTKKIISKLKADNFSESELNNIKFFYFQSGISYEKMGLINRTVMKTYNQVLKLKNNKSEIEAGTSKAIGKSYDHSNECYINPLVDFLNQILNKSLNE